MIYKTSLDGLAKTVTVAVTALFAVTIIFLLFPITSLSITGSFFIAILIGVVYFITYSFRPIDYEITDREIIIHRLIGNVKILREQIITAESIEKKKISWALRVFGVGGLFGYYGKFTNTQLGMMTWYATRRDKLILVKTQSGKKIILTPDDPEKFVEELNNKDV